MSLVLGLSNGGHDSSAAVFRDGKLVAAISEERLSRMKCQGGDIPQLAIDAVLAEAGATRRDVTDIGLMCGYYPEEYFRRLSKKTEAWRKFVRFRRRIRLKATERIWTGHILREARAANIAYADCFRTELFLRKEGFSPSTRVSHHPHHPVHALLAGYYSGFGRCLVLT